MARFIIAAILLLFGGAQAWAHEYAFGELIISDPWARPSLSGSPNGAAYMTIANTGASADKLLEVSAKVAGKAELHTTTMAEGIMRMRSLPGGIEILPGETVRIEPGGLHIMLTGLKNPLKDGEAFSLNLRFEHAGSIEVSVHIENKMQKMPTAKHEHQD